MVGRGRLHALPPTMVCSCSFVSQPPPPLLCSQRSAGLVSCLFERRGLACSHLHTVAYAPSDQACNSAASSYLDATCTLRMVDLLMADWHGYGKLDSGFATASYAKHVKNLAVDGPLAPSSRCPCLRSAESRSATTNPTL